MTGAPIPDGADCVIGQEDTDYGEETVEIYRAVEAYGNYCHAGEDYQAGAKLLERNCVLDPVEAGVLASLGREEVLVYRRPRVSVLTTGDGCVLGRTGGRRPEGGGGADQGGGKECRHPCDDRRRIGWEEGIWS